MKMKALDTLHISALGQHNIQPGDTFEVSDSDAKDLEKRGLAKPVAVPKADVDPPKKAEPSASKAQAPKAKGK